MSFELDKNVYSDLFQELNWMKKLRVEHSFKVTCFTRDFKYHTVTNSLRVNLLKKNLFLGKLFKGMNYSKSELVMDKMQ